MIAVLGIIIIMVAVYIGYKVADEAGAYTGATLVLIALVIFKTYPYFS